MTRPPVTVTIIAFNEESNISAAVQSAKWADEIVVVDSGSTDRTVEIARGLGAKVVSNPWRGYGQQKNFAQDHASHDWIVNIDADEVIPPELAREIQQRIASGPNGFRIPRKTFYLGKWIRHGGWYPNHLVRLAHRKHARWSEPNVHEQLVVDGQVATLDSPLHHFGFPSIESQIHTNLRFSKLGARDLLNRGKRPGVVWLLWKPAGKFLETFFIKRGFMDGLPGLIISINAAHSMFLKYAFTLEPELRSGSDCKDGKDQGCGS